MYPTLSPLARVIFAFTVSEFTGVESSQLDAADHSAGFAESEDAVIVFAALAILAASDAPRISRDIFFMC